MKVESIGNDGRIDRDRLAFVTEQSHLGPLKRSILQTDDVLFTIAGTIGRVSIVDESLLPANTNQAIAIVRPNPERVLPRYLYYALRDQERVDAAMARTVQSVQSNLSLTELGRLPLRLPPVREQRAIAQVLGAFDDKIVANTRLAATARDLARTEFRAHVKGVEGGSATFSDVAEISGGGTPSTKIPAYWDGSVWWATPTDMTALVGPYLEATSRKLTAEGLSACSSKQFSPGAILMTSRATIGTLAVNSVPTAVNQGFIVVEPHDPALRWWLFHEMESRVDEFLSWANGATFLELTRGNFRRLPVRLPERAVVEQFAVLAGSLHDSARACLRENRTLAATRDALLPQLMSGTLRVPDAELIAAKAGA